MKRIVCKPAPELEIELGGGELILLRFDLYSVLNLQESDEGIGGLMKQSIPEMAATIIYAAGKNHNENFTLEKAREIVACMSVENITEVITAYSDAMGVENNAEQGELAKKMMAQFLKSLK